MTSHALANDCTTIKVPRLLFFLFAGVLFSGLSGCGQKPPTFNELIGNTEKKTEEPVTVSAVPEVKPKVEEPVPVPEKPAPPKPAPPKKPTAKEIIAAFYKLHPTEITDNRLAQLAALTEGKENIVELKLSGSRVTPEGFKMLRSFPALAKLDLTQRPITDAEAAVISDLKHLQELNLNKTYVNDQSLAAIADLTELRVLNLDNSSITDRGFIHFKKLKNLEVLTLYQTGIDGSGFTVLAKNKHMRVLSVGKTNFAAYGMKFLNGWNTLESLSLSQAGVTDLTIQKLSFSGLRSLKYLDLSKNSFSDVGMKRLAGMKSLERLSLRDNRYVTGKGMGLLKASKNLQHLDLNGTGCNQAAVDAMLKYFRKFNADMKIVAFDKVH